MSNCRKKRIVIFYNSTCCYVSVTGYLDLLLLVVVGSLKTHFEPLSVETCSGTKTINLFIISESFFMSKISKQCPLKVRTMLNSSNWGKQVWSISLCVGFQWPRLKNIRGHENDCEFVEYKKMVSFSYNYPSWVQQCNQCNPIKCS